MKNILLKNRWIKNLTIACALAATGTFSYFALAVESPIYIGDLLFPIDQNVVVVDNNDSGNDIALQFGKTLNERIYWDANGGVGGTGIFDISERVAIEGQLGVNILLPLSLLHIYENSANTDRTAGINVENEGTGDALVQFVVTGVQRWVMGADNSDGSKFKISSSEDLASAPRLTIDTAGNVGIGTTGPDSTLHVVGGTCIESADSGCAQAAGNLGVEGDISNLGDILTNGFIGINTATPDSDLHVIGGLCVEAADSGCAEAAGNLNISADLKADANTLSSCAWVAAPSNAQTTCPAGQIMAGVDINVGGVVTQIYCCEL